MQLITKKLPKNHRIFFASDFHEGTIMKHKHGVQQFIKHVLSDKNNYVIIGGDLAEAILIDDKRYSADTVDTKTAVPLLQYQAIVKELMPIKDRILTILEGNHDAKLAKYGNFVRDYVCKELGSVYGTYSCKVTIKDLKGNNQYKIFVTHGSTNISSSADDPIRQEANMKLSLKRALQNKASDAAIMVMGHCFSDDTELLTKNGWKKYNELIMEDMALTFNTKEEKSEWQKLEDILIYKNKYNEMIQCRTDVVDFLVTPDHRIIRKLPKRDNSFVYHSEKSNRERKYDLPKGVYKKGNKYEVQIRNKNKIAYSKIFATVEGAKKDYLEKIKNFQTTSSPWTEMPAIDATKHSQITVPISAKSKLPDYPLSDDWIKLLGWLVSEGHFRKNGAVQLYQNWETKQIIIDILNNIGIKHSVYKRKTKGRTFSYPKSNSAIYTTNDDCATFYIKIKDARIIHNYISEKQIPDFCFSFSDRQFDIFIEALMAGDGHWGKHGHRGVYYSKDKILIDTLQALCVSHGWKAAIKDRVRQDRNKQYDLNIVKKEITSLAKNNNNSKNTVWETVPATPTVWCVSVPNGTVYVRRNGKVCILGNCHKLLVAEPLSKLYLTDDETEIHSKYTKSAHSGEQYIHPDHRFYVASGSFLKLYGELGVSGYAEIFGYDPVELGYAVATIENSTIKTIDKVVL